MKSLLIALAVTLFASFASANDGSTPYIEVLGVNPHGNAVGSKIDVYGKETKIFFDALPIDFVYADESRSIQFISGSYIASISCSKSYRRPTTGELRHDHMCSFQNFFKDDWSDPTSPDYDADSYVVTADTLGSMSKGNLKALGIFPQGTTSGTVYSIYGKNAAQVAVPVMQNKGTISFKSGAYTVKLKCQKNYVRTLPDGSKQNRNDYKCDLSYKAN